jgi:hypothetical protein
MTPVGVKRLQEWAISTNLTDFWCKFRIIRTEICHWNGDANFLLQEWAGTSQLWSKNIPRSHVEKNRAGKVSVLYVEELAVWRVTSWTSFDLIFCCSVSWREWIGSEEAPDHRGLQTTTRYPPHSSLPTLTRAHLPHKHLCKSGFRAAQSHIRFLRKRYTGWEKNNSTHQSRHINLHKSTSTQQFKTSTYQHINTVINTIINTSTHQHINTMSTTQCINNSTSTHQHINASTHQYINTSTFNTSTHQHINTMHQQFTSTHQHLNASTLQHIDTSTQSSTHQHINTIINTIINTLTHQHINTSTHQHNVIKRINTSTHEHINTSTQSSTHQHDEISLERSRKRHKFPWNRCVLAVGSFSWVGKTFDSLLESLFACEFEPSKMFVFFSSIYFSEKLFLLRLCFPHPRHSPLQFWHQHINPSTPHRRIIDASTH